MLRLPPVKIVARKEEIFINDISLYVYFDIMGEANRHYLLERVLNDDGSSLGFKMDFLPQQPQLSSSPSFQLNVQEAQKLMDDLWNCGLRPSEGTGSAGALAATQEHLKFATGIVDFVMGLIKENGLKPYR